MMMIIIIIIIIVIIIIIIINAVCQYRFVQTETQNSSSFFP